MWLRTGRVNLWSIGSHSKLWSLANMTVRIGRVKLWSLACLRIGRANISTWWLSCRFYRKSVNTYQTNRLCFITYTCLSVYPLFSITKCNEVLCCQRFAYRWLRWVPQCKLAKNLQPLKLNDLEWLIFIPTVFKSTFMSMLKTKIILLHQDRNSRFQQFNSFWHLISWLATLPSPRHVMMVGSVPFSRLGPTWVSIHAAQLYRLRESC